MSLLQFIVISIVIPSCYNHIIANENQGDKIHLNKDSRDIESFTTILLDNEAYSIASESKHPKNLSKALHESYHRLKGGKGKHHTLNFRLSLAKDASGKRVGKKSVHRKQKISRSTKNLQNRYFGGLERNYRRTRQQHWNGLRTYRFPVMLPISNASNYSSSNEAAKALLSNPRLDGGNNGGIGSSYNFMQNSAENAGANYSNTRLRPHEYFFGSSTPFGLESSSFKTSVLPSNSYKQNHNDSQLHESNVVESQSDNIRPTGEYVSLLTGNTEVMTTTVSPTSSKILQRAAVIQRNLPTVTSRLQKSEKDKDMSTDENEPDDTVITFGGNCDQQINYTCCIQREVGDVLTLSVKINSSKKPESFQVRWMKVYHVYASAKGKSIEIEPTKLPWNMVSGSEGRELRLNPVTNTDMDPNSIVAKVFLITKRKGRTLFTEMKKLSFRIDIPITDMGKLYSGEEVSINIENFISLPERGNLLLDWCLESKPHHYESLPSNIKVSSSGRSVVIKELKKGHMGVLNCVIYSATRFAVAKRRFNILNIAETVKRRSTVMNQKDQTLNTDLQRTRRCRHVLRRSQERAMQRLEEGQRPKSRKKRFRRMESDIKEQAEIDCEPLRKKVYSRWIRSLFGEFTTEDPRLMPIEKLFELSEQGDGTLDNEIPHEVHYVTAKVRILPGTAVERSSRHTFTSNCTSNDDCGKDAMCVILEGQTNSSEHVGFCNCRPEFYGDGFTCLKIPPSSHREKRLRRNANKDFAVPRHLFYERSKETLTVTTPEIAEEGGEDSTFPPKVLAFEEEESFLLSDCIDDKDCSTHASCIQPINGHPYCKCRPGFRGNGIFCWETMDFVPPDEDFLAEDEIDSRGRPYQVMDHSASRTPIPEELEDE